MARNALNRLIILGSALILSACQQGGEVVIPTAIDLEAAAADSQATLDANATLTVTAGTVLAETAVARQTPSREPLPPTWTPSGEPSPAPTLTPRPRNTAEPGQTASGPIYYIENNAQIIELSPFTARQIPVPIPNRGAELNGLAASWDWSTLAYVAPAPGGGRDIWLTDVEGTAQQLTQFGLGRMTDLRWRPNDTAIAFLGSPTADGPLDVYVTNLDGTGQRRLTQFNSANMRDLSWSGRGDKLFFLHDGAVYGLELATTQQQRLTAQDGFGEYLSVAHQPQSDLLLFMRHMPSRDLETTEAVLFSADTLRFAPQPRFSEAGRLPDTVTGLRWSHDGEDLLLLGDEGFGLRSWTVGSTTELVGNSVFTPEPVFSPDSSYIAYINGGADDLSIQQVYLIERVTGEITQRTDNPPGTTISDLVWLTN